MATIIETGTIDLKAQKEAHDEASQVATNYITPNGTSTAAFHPEASSTNQVKVDDTGVDIIKSGTSVAKYGEVARIGKESESRIELDFHSLKLIDKDGNTYLHVSDLRDVNGSATISETFVVDDSTEITSNSTRFELSYLIKSPIADNIVSVVVNGITRYADEYGIYTSEDSVNPHHYLSIYTVLNLGQIVQIEYVTGSAVRAFSFGQRDSNSFVGAESFVEGYDNIASGRISHAEGRLTEASGMYSHAEGNGTEASGHISHAEGNGTEASGWFSHAEGNSTKASSQISHAEGDRTQATGNTSHAEGMLTEASGSYSHAEGNGTEASGSNSHAEGDGTKATGNMSHAEGSYTKASGLMSHAEGSYSIASESYSHAEGRSNVASGQSSHAEGGGTKASGPDSHAEGSGTEASGIDSHAQNSGTIASGEAQTAIGKYNVDDSNGDYAFIIGNGTSNWERSNAFTVDWDGNTFTSGKVELKVPTIDRDNPSSSIYDSSHGILLLDKDGEAIGIIRCLQLSDGRIGATIAAYNEKTSGEQVNNGLNVMVDRNGASSYSMTDPAAFRSAIAAFSTSGGDVTGPVRSKNSSIDRKVNPSSNQYSTDLGGGSSFQLTDKNGAVLGYIRASKLTDGRTGLDLRVWNSDTAGNNAVNGAFQIFIDRSGTVSYSIANQTGFRNAIGASSGVFPRSDGGTGMSGRTTGTVTRTNVSTAGAINAYSNGVVCTVSAKGLQLKTALAYGSTVVLATLPAGYRPPMDVYSAVYASVQSRNCAGFIRIESDGDIHFANESGASWATTSNIAFTVTWAL